jgi:hypothetical protein
MANEAGELANAHRETAIKYTYFLLATAGAAIAFALNQTHGRALSWSQVPLGAAVVCWGIGFYAGCQRVSHVAAGLVGNVRLFEIDAGHAVGTDPTRKEVARKQVEGNLSDHNRGAVRNWYRQSRLLVAGAVMYVTWHVLEMALQRWPALRLW